jgi:hypothetical protein
MWLALVIRRLLRILAFMQSVIQLIHVRCHDTNDKDHESIILTLAVSEAVLK